MTHQIPQANPRFVPSGANNGHGTTGVMFFPLPNDTSPATSTAAAASTAPTLTHMLGGLWADGKCKIHESHRHLFQSRACPSDAAPHQRTSGATRSRQPIRHLLLCIDTGVRKLLNLGSILTSLTACSFFIFFLFKIGHPNYQVGTAWFVLGKYNPEAGYGALSHRHFVKYVEKDPLTKRALP